MGSAYPILQYIQQDPAVIIIPKAQEACHFKTLSYTLNIDPAQPQAFVYIT
jgi:hypothetical protein